MADHAARALIAYELLFALRTHGFAAVSARWSDGSWHAVRDNRADGRLKRVWFAQEVLHE